MQIEKLIYMANQVGKFFAAQGAREGGEDEAVSGIADHLEKFWDPRMRASLLEYIAAGGEGLDPLVRAGAGRLVKTS